MVTPLPIRNGVAVIGMSGRFPGAPDLDSFWELLRDGREGIKTFDREELRRAGIPESVFDATNFVARRPVLDDPLEFDPAFFGYSREEAEWIDPQQRVFLECAWEALETAGIDPAAFPGWIGTWAGCEMNSYVISRDLELMRVLASASGKQFQVDCDKDYLATRVAYKLDLKGPAAAVQSACSTGMVALQLGCQSLLVGQCDVALVGAASISFPQERCHLQYEGSITSADGVCRPFDADANGVVFGDGAAALVLRRLEDAIAAGDPVLAIVRASVANNDGNAKPGFLVPSVSGQESVISVALKMADVDPASISYVEANGTGTPLGDSLEYHAIRRTYGRSVSSASPCTIGSVKSNIGHLTTVSGLAGVIKTILMMRHKQFVPTLHFRKPHPALQFDAAGFRIDVSPRPWESSGSRRAAVSCFGIGGTNVHAVLEEGPAPTPSGTPGPWTFLLSGKTATAVKASARRLSAHLAGHRHADLGNVAFTLRTGRRHHQHRLAVTATDLPGAVTALADERAALRLQNETRRKPRICFLFPAMGVEFRGMARGLYQELASFRAHFDVCARVAREAGLDLVSAVDRTSTEGSLAPSLAEPALFAVEYALAMAWKDFGVIPVALSGCGIGEIVAATLAGVFDRDCGFRIACVRGRLLEQNAALGASSLNPQPDGSPVPELLLAEYGRFLGRTRFGAPTISVLSNRTGEWLSAEQATDLQYWIDQLRASEPYLRKVGTVLSDASNVLLEVGPGHSLIHAVRRASSPESSPLCIQSLPAAGEPIADQAMLRQAAGALWVTGSKLDWESILPAGNSQRIHLPPMAFDRVRCSLPPRAIVFDPQTPDIRAPVGPLGVTQRREHPQPISAEGAVCRDSDRQDALGNGVTREQVLSVSPRYRSQLLSGFLRALVARETGFAAPNLDLEAPLTSLGLDSPMTLRLMHVIETSLGVSVPATFILQGASTAQLVSFALADLGGEDPTVSFGGRGELSAAAARASQRKATQLRRAASNQVSKHEKA